MMASLYGGVGSFLLYALAFLFVLTIVVFIHELGHFLVARWCGVTVTTFSIGFGREIFGFYDRQGTRWRVAWIPLGGYVKFMDDDGPTSSRPSEALEGMTAEQRAGAFHLKPVWQRAAVVAAGPIANFLLAITIFAIGFMIFGLRTTVPRVDEVEVGSAAEKAGFKSGDIIRAIDGRVIASFNDVQRRIATSGGSPMVFRIERGGATYELPTTPRRVETKDQFGNTQEVWRLGIRRAPTPEQVTSESVNPIRAVGLGIKETTFIITSTLGYLSNVIQAKEKPDQLGGPARIADIAGQVAQQGLFDLIYLAAFISVSVGLVNLFPIPLLDGGHLMFYAIEALRGRPLSEKTQEIGFRIGMALVLSLMLFSFWNDIPIIRRWLT
jgi:regulator of sigma E protease